MSLDKYFESLMKRIEDSDLRFESKDKDGFFEPTRVILLQKIALLRDLHSKPNAKPMLKSAWQYVVDHVPPDWLILSSDEKQELKKILSH